MINTKTIQKLRRLTGAGIMDVKKALTESDNDETKALEILRKQGQKIAAQKQAEREATEGLVAAYIHNNGKIGSLIVLSCETDFVAKNKEFQNLAHDLAMQTVAMNPQYISPQEIPAEVIEQEKEIYHAALKNEGKPDEIIEKIIAGKLNKFYEEVCLLNQTFIKDDTQTISDLITAATAKLGEKIEITQMARFAI